MLTARVAVAPPKSNRISRIQPSPRPTGPARRIHPGVDTGPAAILVIGQHLVDRVARVVGIDPHGLTMLVAAQHQEHLVVLAEQLVPHHLWRVVDRIHAMPVDDGVGHALAFLVHVVVRREDRRQARMATHHRGGPLETGIRRIELQPDVQEAVAPGAEELRAVGAAVVRIDVPRLALEKGWSEPNTERKFCSPPGCNAPSSRSRADRSAPRGGKLASVHMAS